MPSLSRRQLLTSAAAAAAASFVPTPARACGMSSEPRVLEIFLKGGFSPWQSFWYDAALALAEGTPTWSQITGLPNYVPPATSVSGLHLDTLGPAARALSGTTIGSHLRVAVMRHELEPHEAAVPFSLTGTRLGRPQLKGIAAAVNASIGDTPLHAFVLDAGHAATAAYAAEAGELGSAWRPPVLRVGDPDLLARLQRPQEVTAFDGVERQLADEYAAKMVHATTQVTLRSRGFSAYDNSIRMLQDHSDALYTILAATDLASAVTDPPTSISSLTTRAVRVAAQLLRSAHDIRYCCVIDAGVRLSYDTHDDTGASPATTQAENMASLCLALRTLDLEGALDGILVVLNTEFGRKQLAAGTPGTEHWPQGYVNVLMGAPFTAAQHRGDIDANGFATDEYEPQDIRATLAAYLELDAADVVDTSLLTRSESDLKDELLLGDAC